MTNSAGIELMAVQLPEAGHTHYATVQEHAELRHVMMEVRHIDQIEDFEYVFLNDVYRYLIPAKWKGKFQAHYTVMRTITA